MNKYEITERMKFDSIQIENIIDKVVPLVAAPEDHEFFRGVLFCKAEECNSAEFSVFIQKMLETHAANQVS